MNQDEILAELQVLVEERNKVNQAQEELIELTKNNREMYEQMKEKILESSEPFTKLREYELEEHRDGIRQKEIELLWEIERYRLTINIKRDELVEQLRELALKQEEK